MASSKPNGSDFKKYSFWAWQYTARNKEFIEKRTFLCDFVGALEKNGVMSKYVDLDIVARRARWEDSDSLLLRSPVQHGWSTRRPTEEEHGLAQTALGLQQFFSSLNYDYPDIKIETTLADDIINNFETYVEMFQYPEKQVYTSSYPFQSKRMLIEDDKNLSTGLFNTRIGNDFGGKRKVLIDFSLPIETILSEVRAIYEQLNSSGSKELYCAIRKNVRSKSGVTTISDAPRAIGLWLWDYIHANSCKQNAAIRELGETGHLRLLNMENLEDTDLRFFLRRTKACIEAREVLSFSKKGT